jgi:O-antigen/teichoic acid export membrane protein
MTNYGKNIGSSFFVNGLSLVISFITSILVARSLGPAGKGYVAFILMVLTLVANYGHFGVLNATSYFQKIFKKTNAENIIFWTNFLYVSVLSLLFSGTLMVLSRQGAFMSEYSGVYMSLGATYIFFSFVYTLFYQIFVGRDKVYVINNFLALERSLYFVTTLLLFFTGHLTVFTYFLTNVILIALRVSGIYLASHLKVFSGFDKKLLYDEFSYGKYIYLTGLLIYLNYRVDQFMINYMLGKAQLGIYSVGVQLAELAFLIPTSIAAPLLGRLLNVEEKDNSSRIKTTTATIRYTFNFTLVVSLLGIVISPLVVILYGKDFAQSAIILVILLIGIAFASIGKVAPSFYHSIGKTRQPLIVAFLVCSLNLGLNWWWIPILGIKGAALASTISYTFYGLFYLWVLVRKEGFSLRELVVMKRSDLRFLLNMIRKGGERVGSIILRK